MKTSEAQRHALALVAGCQGGITIDSLKCNGVTQRTIDTLIKGGKVTTRTETMAKPAGLEVTWLHLAR